MATKLSESEFAQLFITYAELGERRDAIKKTIEEQVIIREGSSKIAGVEAKYYKPSFETPDYEAVAKANMPKDFDISPYSTPKEPSVKWKEVCEALQIEVPKGAPKPAWVSIK